jgi:hypothetical protein
VPLTAPVEPAFEVVAVEVAERDVCVGGVAQGEAGRGGPRPVARVIRAEPHQHPVCTAGRAQHVRGGCCGGRPGRAVVHFRRITGSQRPSQADCLTLTPVRGRPGERVGSTVGAGGALPENVQAVGLGPRHRQRGACAFGEPRRRGDRLVVFLLDPDEDQITGGDRGGDGDRGGSTGRAGQVRPGGPERGNGHRSSPLSGEGSRRLSSAPQACSGAAGSSSRRWTPRMRRTGQPAGMRSSRTLSRPPGRMRAATPLAWSPTRRPPPTRR